MRTEASTPRSARTAEHTVGVLGKALDVLDQLVWSQPKNTREIAADTGIEKAAVYRILNTLTERGFAAKDEDTRSYHPGPRLMAAASVLTRSDDLLTSARPHMARVRDELGETVNLGMLVGAEIQYLEILESHHSLRMAAEVGSRDPAHSTALGKAILAWLDDDTLERALGQGPLHTPTADSVVDVDAFRAELGQIRERGYSIDLQQNEVGAVCVAAPIRRDDRSVHAISVSGPATRMLDGLVDEVGSVLVGVAGELSGPGSRP